MYRAFQTVSDTSVYVKKIITEQGIFRKPKVIKSFRIVCTEVRARTIGRLLMWARDYLASLRVLKAVEGLGEI